jgi:hypothetical protein
MALKTVQALQEEKANLQDELVQLQAQVDLLNSLYRQQDQLLGLYSVAMPSVCVVCANTKPFTLSLMNVTIDPQTSMPRVQLTKVPRDVPRHFIGRTKIDLIFAPSSAPKESNELIRTIFEIKCQEMGSYLTADVQSAVEHGDRW